MSQYSNNPRLTKSKFSSDCAWCGARLRKGDDIFCWPSKRQVLCFNCGNAPYRQFLAALADKQHRHPVMPSPFAD